MGITSIESPGFGGNASVAHDGADHCETCGAAIDLAKSVLLKRNRFVGCVECAWGALLPALSAPRAPSVMQAHPY